MTGCASSVPSSSATRSAPASRSPPKRTICAGQARGASSSAARFSTSATRSCSPPTTSSWSRTEPALAVNVNVLGMVNMFEAALRHRLARLVFTSSETVYGASQARYGERPVTEHDFCAPADHFFTYGVMKLLDEFMAQKFMEKHDVS